MKSVNYLKKNTNNCAMIERVYAYHDKKKEKDRICDPFFVEWH